MVNMKQMFLLPGHMLNVSHILEFLKYRFLKHSGFVSRHPQSCTWLHWGARIYSMWCWDVRFECGRPALSPQDRKRLCTPLLLCHFLPTMTCSPWGPQSWSQKLGTETSSNPPFTCGCRIFCLSSDRKVAKTARQFVCPLAGLTFSPRYTQIRTWHCIPCLYRYYQSAKNEDKRKKLDTVHFLISNYNTKLQ